MSNGKKLLADLTPKGQDMIALRAGDDVELAGEMKPSELKVFRIKRKGEDFIEIGHEGPKHHGPQHHGPKHHDPHHHHHADPAAALKTAKDKGFSVIDKPISKPKHFELLAKDENGSLFELHIEHDGAFRKMKTVAKHDPKWAHLASGEIESGHA